MPYCASSFATIGFSTSAVSPRSAAVYAFGVLGAVRPPSASSLAVRSLRTRVSFGG
jgi:hypothetical protein